MNLRMLLDHFPDANLEDIEEEDEEEDCDMCSDDSAEDSREAVISQDGLTSDDTDLEPFSKMIVFRLFKIKISIQNTKT